MSAREILAAIASPLGRLVCVLGVGQIIAWGSTFYALGVLAKPIAADTGWSSSVVFAGSAVALLVSGAISAPVGRLIDRWGARTVMTLGSIVAGAGLAGVAMAASPAAYLSAWAVVGVGMRASLYEAAFAALVQIAGVRGRPAISALTLFGGLASTVFWPIGHALDGALGWRETLLVFAALNALVCAPMHALVLSAPPRDPRARPAAAVSEANTGGPAAGVYLEGTSRTVALALFAAVISLNGVVFGALGVHLVPMLEAYGLGAGAAVLLASCKGVAQVAGRVWEIFFARAWPPLQVGRVAVWGMPVAFALLLLPFGALADAIAFTIVYGVANGLITIVRGAVPLALFGPVGYGGVTGLISTPYLLLTALAPVALALFVERWGYGAGMVLLCAIGAAAGVAIEIMAVWYRRVLTRGAR